MKITAVILASGFSRRFEGNKLLAEYKKKPLVRHIVDKVIRQNFHEIIVVSQYEEILKWVNTYSSKDSRVKAVKNNFPERGITSSIKLGVKNAEECEGYMFFTGDAPLIKEETIKQMMRRFNRLPKERAPILRPYYKEQKGSPVIFSSCYKEELLQLEGDKGGSQIIAKHKACEEIFRVSHEEELWDIDTQLAYEKLLQKDS